MRCYFTDSGFDLKNVNKLSQYDKHIEIAYGQFCLPKGKSKGFTKVKKKKEKTSLRYVRYIYKKKFLVFFQKFSIEK